MRPVSSLRVFPPSSISTVFVLNIDCPFTPRARCRRDSSGRQSGLRSVRGVRQPHERPAELRDWTYAKRPASGPLLKILLTKAELGDQVGVARLVLAAEVIQQRAALVDHHQQA